MSDEPARPGPPGADEITVDTLLRGRVRLYQPRRGFRSSLDPVLLASFIPRPYGRFLDIGCGTGAVSFLLLARDRDATGVGVELQPRLADLAARGVTENAFGDRFAVRRGDIRQCADLGLFDLIATNPPFRPLGTAVLPPDEERAIAHHEVTLSLDAWLTTVASCLAPAGRLAVIFPAYRAADLHAALATHALHPTRQRLVIPQAGAPPGRVLLEARRSGDLTIEPPLVVHESGKFTPEVQLMVES
jgi:tRNA1Val (adenine37-N6)-methyltransferase